MRTIERTGQFKRDFKREAKGQHRLTVQADLTAVVMALANDQTLDPRLRDHGLTGDWKDHRDCHIKPDLVLIYRLPDGERRQLVRMGSHSELGLCDKLHGPTSSHGPQPRDFIGEGLHDGSQPGDIGVWFCVVLLKTLVSRLQGTQAITVSFGLGLGLPAGQGSNSIRHIGVSVVDQGGCSRATNMPPCRST